MTGLTCLVRKCSLLENLKLFLHFPARFVQPCRFESTLLTAQRSISPSITWSPRATSCGLHVPRFRVPSPQGTKTVPFHQRNCCLVKDNSLVIAIAQPLPERTSPSSTANMAPPKEVRGSVLAPPCRARCYLLGTFFTTDRHSNSYLAVFQEGTIGNKALQARLSRTHGCCPWHRS